MANIENKSTANVTLYADGQVHTKLPTVYVKQGDKNSRCITVSVMLREGQLVPGAGSVCQLNCLKPDKTVVVVDGDVNEDGTITFSPKGSVFATDGDVLAEVSIIEAAEDGAESSQITTSQLIVKVEKSISANNAIADSDDYDGVSKNLRKIAAHRKAAENACKSLQAQERTVAEHDEAISAIKEVVKGLSDKVTLILDSNAAVKEDLKSLTASVATIKEQVETISVMPADVSDITNADTDQSAAAHIEEIKQRIAEFDTALSNVREAVEKATATQTLDSETAAQLASLTEKVNVAAEQSAAALKNTEALRLNVRKIALRTSVTIE